MVEGHLLAYLECSDEELAEFAFDVERWGLALDVWNSFEQMYKQRFPRRGLDRVRLAWFSRLANGRSREFWFHGSDWRQASAAMAGEAARGGRVWSAGWSALLERNGGARELSSRLAVSMSSMHAPQVSVSWNLDSDLLAEWGDLMLQGLWQAMVSVSTLFPVVSARVGLEDRDSVQAVDMEWLTGPFPRTPESVGIIAGYRSMAFLPLSAVEVLGGLGTVLATAPVAEVQVVNRGRDVFGVVARLVNSIGELSEERLRAWRSFLEPVAAMPRLECAPEGFMPQSRPLDVVQDDWPIPLAPPSRHLRIVT